MDKFIAKYNSRADDDLMFCFDHGVAYQRDMSVSVAYDEDYFNKCRGYEGQEIANKINAARVGLVDRIAGPSRKVLDIGIGSGEFIKSRPNTFGDDINAKAVAWLQEQGKWRRDLGQFDAFTFWDVLEHVPIPECYFGQMKNLSLLFTSLPIFDDLRRIRESKHYRPNEHFYYWTRRGFIAWMNQYGFRLIEQNDDETKAGRERILSFAFQRAV